VLILARFQTVRRDRIPESAIGESPSRQTHDVTLGYSCAFAQSSYRADMKQECRKLDFLVIDAAGALCRVWVEITVDEVTQMIVDVRTHFIDPFDDSYLPGRTLH
jgi:hypothetical protein